MNQDAYWERLSYQKHDLSNCESEPLAFCGAIQSGGVFLGCDLETGLIHAVSMNTDEYLKISPSEVLGTQVSELLQFGDGSVFSIDRAREISKSGILKVKTARTEKRFDATVAKNAMQFCIDLEPEGAGGDSVLANGAVYDPVQDLKHLVHLLDEASGVEEVTARAVEQIRIITGYDRVMVYRFAANWDGQVIAESRREDLESWLGLHYPGSDIPAQARKLYFETKFRMILDSKALPVPIGTLKGLGRSEIDLSCTAFRASSPMHIQYLQNMGVRSSFSLPIKLNGELWGLVSCHGYGEPIHPSRPTRAACELAVQVLSGRISDALSERRLKIKAGVYELSQSLLASVTEGQSAVEAFRSIEKSVLELTASTGAYIRIGGEDLRIGICPPPEYILSVREKLASKLALSLWMTQSLSESMDLAPLPEATGALAVPFSLGFEDLLIWFRPEVVHEVKWGGKPTDEEKISKSLTPRASFGAWTQTVKGKSREWGESDRESAQYLLFTLVQGIFKKAADLSRANVELEKATRAKDEFIGMVSHELRTPLGVMMGWIDVLRDYQFRDPEVLQAIETIDRNARLQINLINDLLDVSRIVSGKMRIEPKPDVDVARVVEEAVSSLRPTAAAKSIRLVFEPMAIPRIVADEERLRQIVWNLITNAIKFTPKEGRVNVQVFAQASSVRITVRDSGIGIPSDHLGRIFNRFEQIGENGARTGGLGLGLSIVKSLVDLHGGSVTAESEGAGKGSLFTVSLPVYAFRAVEEGGSANLVPLKAQTTKALEGLKILLAEDQLDSATAMGHLLRRQGADLVITHDGKEAFHRLKSEKFDLLLSDIGMPEWDGYRLISEWRKLEAERGMESEQMPAIALTAYATSQDRTKALHAGFQSHIPKPLDKGELLAVIETLKIKK